MKKLFLLIFIFPCITIIAQFDLSLSMGLDFKTAPSFRDYVNSNFAPPNNQLSSFSSSVSFSGEVGYHYSSNMQCGIEYSLLLDSYNTPIGSGGKYEISYSSHRPSIILYYVISGQGYKFKFGGGLGLRFISLTEDIFVQTNYTSTGVGILLKADGNTLISENLFALIGVDVRYDLPGEIASENNSKIVNFANGEIVNLNALSVGIKLGVSYNF